MKTCPNYPRRRWLALLGCALAGLVAPLAAAQDAPAEQLLLVTVVKLKPGMTAEWEAMQKSDVLPALKRAGQPWRHVWGRGVFGPANEFHLVSPITRYAQFDDPLSPLAKGLGEAGMAAYRAKVATLVESSTTFAIRSLPTLSWEPSDAGTPNIAVLTFVQVAPGRRKEFFTFLETDFVPVVRKSDLQTYFAYETIFGGSASEFITVALDRNFAALDKGPAIARVLGKDGADALMAKLPVGVVTGIQRHVIRYRPELSISRETQPKAATTQ